MYKIGKRNGQKFWLLIILIFICGWSHAAVPNTSNANVSVNRDRLFFYFMANEMPTVTPVPDQSTSEDVPIVVSLTGISAGASEPGQMLTIIATSSNTSIVPDGVVDYVQGSSTGSITFTPVADAFGTVDITLTIQDDGGTSDPGDMDTNISTFELEVTSVNDDPTLDDVTSPTAILEDSGEQSVGLTGISDGDPEADQNLTITATSDNLLLIGTVTVDYTQLSPTATLAYTPLADANGTAVITVSVSDGDKSVEKTFTVIVDPVNDDPTLDDITSPTAILEDSGEQSIGLTGISDGDPETDQNLTITATSDNLLLVGTVTADYTQLSPTATLAYTPLADANGTAVITVNVSDGDKSVEKTFTVTVDPINDDPTLDDITSPTAILEDSGEQTITLSGITPGPNEDTQNVTVTATSNLPGIIPDPTVSLNAGIWSISYTPEPNQSGDVVITVVVTDDDPDPKSISRQFTQSVLGANDPPTINAMNDISIDEDSGVQSVAFDGISDDGDSPQNLTITAISDQPTIIPNPSVNYTSPNASGSLDFAPQPDQFGTVNITVRVTDKNALFAETTFEVAVANVNDPPTLNDIIAPGDILEDAGAQSIDLTGISAGPNESETVQISVLSDNTSLINNPVGSISGNTGTVSFTPISNASGTATLTVRIDDGQSGDNIIEKNVVVTVLPVNDAPIFNIGGNQTLSENSGSQTINAFATGMDDGDPETQMLAFQISTVLNTGNLAFDTEPTINLATGDLTFESTSNTNGSVTVTVILSDDGGTTNGGIDQLSKTFDILVTAVNEPPSFSLNGNPPATNEDAGAVTVNAFASDMDDGDPELDQQLEFEVSQLTGDLTFSSPPSIDPITGVLTYTPADNSNGTALMNVLLKEIVSTKSSGAEIFTITVDAINDAPVGQDEAVSTEEDVPYQFDVSDFTYSDVESDPFSGIQIIGLESSGDLEYNGLDVVLNQECPNLSLLVFKPDINSNGSTTFEFKLMDSDGELSETYVMTIMVTPVNDDPTSANSEVSTQENTPYNFKMNDFTFNDPDGDTFSGIRIYSIETKGDLEYNGNDVQVGTEITNFNMLQFIPAINENGAPYATFEFEVEDSEGNYSTEYTMSINVGATNDRPTGGNGKISMLEDGSYSFQSGDFTFNDVDGHLFDGIQIESLETSGDLEYNGADVVSVPTYCPDVTKLIFKPTQDEAGNNYATFTFKVKDNSSSLNLSNATYTMTIDVTAVNDPPVFTISGNPPAVNEDVGSQSVPGFITSINDGDPDQNQQLQFSEPQQTDVTGNLSFSTAPRVDIQGELTYRPAANTYGTATFSIFLTDNGKTENGGQDQSITQFFTITVNSVNDQPTINPIADRPAILEDAGTQTVNIANITAGPLENQPISLTVTSSNRALIPAPIVGYTSPNTTGSISYTPVADQSGTSLITITVSDGEMTDGKIEESFLVTVTPVNDPPTLDDIVNPAPIPENSGEQTVQLSGISAGGGETQTVIVTAESGNTAIIPTPTVKYIGGSTAQLTYTPAASVNGVTTITVTVDDQNGKSVKKSFDVAISTVNDPPTLDPISEPASILEDAGEQNITLTGISAGLNENQTLTITAASSNTSLISNLDVDYTNPAATAVLSYTANQHQFGSAIITVTVNDGNVTNNLISRQVKVTVLPVPDLPTVSNASTNQGVQSTTGLVIDRNENDGGEVSYFKITNIRNGTLFLSDGVSQISNNEFITYAQGKAGLRFFPSSNVNGSFDVQASLTNANSGLGPDIATAIIFINSIPTTTNLPDLTLNEDSPKVTFDLYQTFNDKEDTDANLTFEVANTAPNIATAVISGRTLTITLLKDKSGTAYITVKCTDTKGAFVEDEIKLDITPVNDKPVFTSNPVIGGQQGVEYQYNIVTADVENDSRYFDWIAPPWLWLTDNGDGTATLSGTPGESDNGNHDIEIIVYENNSNLSNSQKFTLKVNNKNDPPVFVSNPPTEAFETEKYTYLIEISDPDANDSYEVYVDPATTLDWLILSAQAPYTLQGFPPVGSSGSYTLKLIVIDDGGLTAEQTFTIVVSSHNTPPRLDNFDLPDLEEDQSYVFKPEDFTSVFTDDDPDDALEFITIVELPVNGSMTLKGTEIHENDTIYRNEISSLVFVPNDDFYGFTYFIWNASDGKSMAQTSRVDISIASVEDAPKIVNVETEPKIYAFGEISVFVTESAEVLEVDDGKIGFAKVTITGNYLNTQDSLAIDNFDGITTSWNDTTGVLTIIGIKSDKIYQEIIRSLVYLNQKQFAPNVQDRTIEIIVSDGDSLSVPVSRDIVFEDSFVPLVIPTGITPNGDDANDTWEIEHIQNHEDAIVRIYSREGVVLYESEGYYEPWDGTYNGTLVKPGVYYYTINIQNFGKRFTGSITVLR